MICLTNCFSHHVLGQIMLMPSTASHHDVWCWWCDCTSGRCFFVFDGNLVLSVLLCLAGETFVVRLCLPPSKVKLWFAPSEVHYRPFRRLGGGHNSRFLSCGAFENIGQAFQSYILFVADLTKRACRLRM
jgi:hypothetical protein